MSSRSSRSFCFIFFRMVRRPMVPAAPARPLFLPSPGLLSLLLLAITPTEGTAYWPTPRLVPPSLSRDREVAEPGCSGPSSGDGGFRAATCCNPSHPEGWRYEGTAVPPSPGPQAPLGTET